MRFTEIKTLMEAARIQHAEDIIFWEGHVAVCINSKKLIHAYGPERRVLTMPIKKTIDRIEKTANLIVKKISNIKNY